MAYMSRINNDPFQIGYIVRQFITCGKKNCRCYTRGEKHEVYRLKYREYNLVQKTSKQKMLHIKKSEVAEIQRGLSTHKGMFLLMRLGDWAIFQIAAKYPKLEGEKLYIKAYSDYGRSKYTQQWLKLKNSL